VASDPSLGRLVSVHPIAPAQLQRAIFIAVLSLMFFFGMMFAYYLRGSIGYFLLATAFLIVYIAMMYSIFTGRKKTVEIYENGLRVGRETATWNEIDDVDDAGIITLANKKRLAIPLSILDRDRVVALIRDSVK